MTYLCWPAELILFQRYLGMILLVEIMCGDSFIRQLPEPHNIFFFLFYVIVGYDDV